MIFELTDKFYCFLCKSMKKNYYRLIILFLFLGFSSLLVSQESKGLKGAKESEESKEVDLSYEEFKAMRKKEQEMKKAQEKEQEYRDYVEFQEFKRRKSVTSAEEQEMEKKRNEGKIAYAPWAVQYLGTSAYASETNGRTGRSGQFLVSAEYHEPTSKIGYRLGLSAWNYNYGNRSDRFERDLIIATLISQGRFFIPLLLDESLYRKTTITGNSLDFFVDYHFKPRKFVDPYFFGGVGVGICDYECNAFKVSVGGGVRVNLKSGYFLSELIAEKPFFAFSERNNQVGNPNLFISGIRIGFGMFL